MAAARSCLPWEEKNATHGPNSCESSLQPAGNRGSWTFQCVAAHVREYDLNMYRLTKTNRCVYETFDACPQMSHVRKKIAKASNWLVGIRMNGRNKPKPTSKLTPAQHSVGGIDVLNYLTGGKSPLHDSFDRSKLDFHIRKTVRFTCCQVRQTHGDHEIDYPKQPSNYCIG